MYNIVSKDEQILAVIGNIQLDINEKGWIFPCDINDPLQWGIGNHNKGLELVEHIHKLRKRIKVHKTHEFVLVINGSIETRIYDNEQIPIDTFILSDGDFIYLIDGGHGFTILEDGTKLLEIKNGPFARVAEDKVRFTRNDTSI
jgi:hypothetical protein